MQTITIISNNSANEGFFKEHGFSVLIDYNNKTLLFDTGNGNPFRENLQKLNINLSLIDFLVLSHGHYDHCGNIAFVLTSNPKIKTFIHPDGLKERFSIHSDRDPMVSRISMSNENRESIINNNTTYTTEPTNIYKSIFVTGSIPRLTDEDTGGPFFDDSNGLVVDTIPDDQSLFIKTDEGLIIITGCCHSGLINTVEYIKKISGISKVKTIIGGLHLSKASKLRVDKTILYLNSLNLKNIFPGHCTGEGVIKTLKLELNCSVLDLNAGLIAKI